MTDSRRGLRAWWVAAAGVVAGLLVVVFGPVRLGGYVLAGAFALAAVLRLVLPVEQAGGLAVRSKALDIGAYALLAAALAVGFALVDLR